MAKSNNKPTNQNYEIPPYHLIDSEQAISTKDFTSIKTIDSNGTILAILPKNSNFTIEAAKSYIANLFKFDINKITVHYNN